MPFYLQAATIPGDANWVFEVPGSVGPITGLTFVDATFGGASDGSIAAPFTTIQAALDFIGDATTLAEQFEGWKVIISANFYDEDLVIPKRRSIALDCAPGTILADAFPPTAPAKKITWEQNLAPLGGVEDYVLQINNLTMFDGIELISAAPATAAMQLSLRLNQVIFIGGIIAGTIPSIDGTALALGSGAVELRDCLVRPFTAGGFCFDAGATNAVYISYANSCEFDAPIRALGYGQMVNCTFADDQTYTNQTSLGSLDRPEGFFGCEFENSNPHTFTMTVPDFALIDDVSWNFLSFNWTFVGATIRSLSNPFIAGNTLAGGATWAAGGDNTLSNAIDRIAASVSGLLGGTIP